MSDFGTFILFMVLVCIAFVLGALLVGNTPTYELGQESTLLIEQCELPLAREEFCELVAKPEGAE